MLRMPFPAVLAAALIVVSPALGQEARFEFAAVTDVVPAMPDLVTEEELAAFVAPEDMTADTDLRPYMQPGVPDAIRNAALRMAWTLKPAIRDHIDPALDYAQ